MKDNSAEFGLSVNLSKTKVMLIGNHDSSIAPSTDEVPIKIVPSRVFERVISNDGSDMPALLDRIGKAWGAFEKKKDLITSKRLPMKSKRQIYETYILPVVMYATETMTWSNDMLNKLRGFNNHIMRWMCGTKLCDKQPIATLHRRTGVHDITNTVKARKLQWFGHVKRSNLMVKTTIKGHIEGKRRRGRPSRR